MIQNDKTWCVNADHSMTGSNNGETKICCMQTTTGETRLNLKEHTIQEIFNQSKFIEIRNDLANGVRHKSCNKCWEEEDAGRDSKRVRDNERFTKLEKPYIGLAKVELNLGNTCNLKCRTCGIHASSQWMKEHFDLFDKNKFKDYKSFAQTVKPYYQTYEDDSPFWDDLITNLGTIKELDFYGGEPFMSSKMWHVLAIAVEQGYAKDIELNYATNGTLWPDDKIAVFKHFKKVNLNFSIDGIGKKFEYMRHNAVWTEVVANMDKARQLNATNKNMFISWCVTLSTLNIYDLPEILDEYYTNFKHFSLYLNLVHSPEWYNIARLPADVKEAVLAKINTVPKHYDVWNSFLPGIIKFIENGQYNKTIWDTLFLLTYKSDEYRNEKFSEVFPEYNKIVGMYAT